MCNSIHSKIFNWTYLHYVNNAIVYSKNLMKFNNNKKKLTHKYTNTNTRYNMKKKYIQPNFDSKPKNKGEIRFSNIPIQ